MYCKNCGIKTRVIEPRYNTRTDETYRQRICPKCGKVTYTVEFAVDMDDRFKKDWSKCHRNKSTTNYADKCVQMDMFDAVDELMRRKK